MKTICIVGYGYWGAVLLKHFMSNNTFNVKYICDRNPDKLKQAKKVSPDNCILISDPVIAFDDAIVDLIVIATQAATHFNLSMSALKANKHIFVEKPFMLSSFEANHILQLAHERNRKIWIDHTFLFSAGYQKLKQCFAQGMIGKPLRFHSTRTAFGLFQRDTNIIWHLMVHDIYLLFDLFQTPEKINSVISSVSVIPNILDSVIVSLTFPEQLHATIHCDMLFFEKKREIVITGDKGILVWDETRQDKLSFYPFCAAYDFDTKKVSYQLEKIELIKVDESEALTNEIDKLSEFLNDENCLTFPSKYTLLKIIGLLELIEAMDKKSCLV